MPLSYEASKFVLQYLPIESRLNIRLRCPELHTADAVVPLKLDAFQMDPFSSRFDNLEFKFTSDKFDADEVRDGRSDQITIIDHKRSRTRVFDFEEFRDMDVRRSFLMHKLLGGRRDPAIVENFELKGSLDLQFPEDFKMKVKNVEVHRIKELVMQQLSNHIVGDPLSTFRFLTFKQNKFPNFNKHPLIQNAQKIGIPMDFVLKWPRKAFAAFSQKEIVINDTISVPGGFSLVENLALARRNCDLQVMTNLTVHTVKACENNIFETLVEDHQARRAVVDDVESNLFNIPCVCLPMGPTNELNVYGIPGTISHTTLKIRVMAEGSARVNE